MKSELLFSMAVLLLPCAANAQTTTQQQSVPAAAREVEQDVKEVVKRFRIGVDGGVGFDPELIMFGAHGSFGPLFHRGVQLRPGIEIGIGEVTTLLGINFDVLYTLPGATGQTRWTPYIGAGPTFGLSHRGFGTDEIDHVAGATDGRSRFDFGDTDFVGGMNFIAGARSRGGLFFELKATAWGVSNVRLMAGFNF